MKLVEHYESLSTIMTLTGIPINIDVSDDYKIFDKFTDKKEISDWSKTHVTALVEMGVVKRDENKLMPKSYITRAQAAVIIRKLLKEVNLIQ